LFFSADDTGLSEPQEEVFFDGIIEYYMARPVDPTFENMALIVFATWYTKGGSQGGKSKVTDILDEDIEETGEDTEKTKQTATCNRIKLLHGKGYMNKKVRENVTRLPRLNLSDNKNDIERYCFSKLMTYIPFREERLTDIMKGYESYEDCFLAHQKTIEEEMKKYEKGTIDIRKAFQQINEKEPDLRDDQEDLERVEEMEDVDVLSCFPGEADLEVEDSEEHYDKSFPQRSNVNETIARNKEYYADIQSLNEEQKRIFWYMHDWCRQKKQDPHYPPLRIGIIGAAGTGKTKIINVIYELFQRQLHESGEIDDAPVCVKLSFTGMAACNIDGITWHSFMGRGHGKIDSYEELSEVSKAKARDRWRALQVIIEDEISLETSKMDYEMDRFLNAVFQIPVAQNDAVHYNDISVIKVGDFMQLNMDIWGKPLFKSVGDIYGKFRPNNWKTNFRCFELTQSMRQKEKEFARIVQIVRHMTIGNQDDLSKLTEEQKEAVAFLRSRDIQPSHPDYPHTALHLFPTNSDVNTHNGAMIKTVPNVIKLTAQDSAMDQTGSFKITSVKKVKDDQGLPDELVVGIGAKVMVTRNQNVEDGIVNGMLGIVTGFTKSESEQVIIIWVKPDTKKAGMMKRKELKREYQSKFPGAIPIKRVEANVVVAKNSTYKRCQFPLKLSFAATVHKYQGRSLDVIVIGGFKGKGWKGKLLLVISNMIVNIGVVISASYPPLFFQRDCFTLQ
jgi:hypothetical protein